MRVQHLARRDSAAVTALLPLLCPAVTAPVHDPHLRPKGTQATGRAAEPAALEKELDMSHEIPAQHPAVVLRSHYMHLRALLATAMIAVVGLTIAVVILATSDSAGTSARATAPLRDHPISAPAKTAPGQRYDGGPEEGTRGPFAAPISPSTRYDGGPEEGTRGAKRFPAP